MIASVTVSATTISNKLIEKRKTSYKSDVIYQKSFATEDGKLLEYNRNPAKKMCSISTLKDTSIHFAHECSRRTNSSVLRVGAKRSYCS